MSGLTQTDPELRNDPSLRLSAMLLHENRETKNRALKVVMRLPSLPKKTEKGAKNFYYGKNR